MLLVALIPYCVYISNCKEHLAIVVFLPIVTQRRLPPSDALAISSCGIKCCFSGEVLKCGALCMSYANLLGQ